MLKRSSTTRSTIALSALACLLLICAIAACKLGRAGNQTTEVPLTTRQWIVVGADSKQAAGRLSTTTGSDGKQLLQYQVKRDGNEAIAHPMSLSGFSELSLNIWSAEKTVVAVVLEDSDKAKFHAGIPLMAGTWTPVILTPANFELNEDSPIKKNTLDAKKVSSPLILTELGRLIGLKQPNTIRLAAVQVRYGQEQPANLNIPSIIDGTTVNITTNGTISHAVMIKNGGRLVVNAPNVHLAGNIAVDRGNLEIAGGRLSVDCRFQHQYKLHATNGSKIILSNCQFYAPFPTELGLVNSNLKIENCTFPSMGFTCAPANSTIVLDAAKQPGEFIVEPTSRFTVSNCRAILFWLNLGAGQKVDMPLPSALTKIDNFQMTAESKLNLAILNSEMVMWALVTRPQCDVTIHDSSLRAVGMAFPDTVAISISGIKDNAMMHDSTVKISDRKMRFVNSSVKAWTFYPLKTSHVLITDCLFGEMNAFDNAHVDIANSTCDGSGGYIRVSDNSKASLTNCILNCSVVATNRGQITLDHCKVTGDTTASDDSTISLVNTTLSGRRQQLGHGRIK